VRSHSIVRFFILSSPSRPWWAARAVPRQQRQASYRMPQIASYVVDTEAAALLAAWIDATKSCP
jgi:hypothetical protein